METVHVLVVSDNQSDIEQIRDLLATSSGAMVHFHVESEVDYASALRSLVRNQYDVFLVDHIVPGTQMSGTDLVKKANAGGCRSPVLVLTTLPDEDMDWALDDAGAAGHVNKHLDFHERTLRNAIRTAIKHNKDVTEVREQLRELQRQVAELIQAFERRT
jgi:DNA-binding NarL/FixJ family response regulator